MCIDNIILQHINARSLCKNFPQIYSHIYEDTPAVICVSETWLTSNSTGFFIDGYNFIHRNRCGNVRGGGVGIYLKNTFLYQRLSDIEYIDIEQLWISVNHLKHTFIIAVIYRPPNQDLKVFLDNMRRTLNSLYNIVHRHTVFITGDFNIDQANDNNYEFTELFEQFGFVQIVNDFTRITNTIVLLYKTYIYSLS